MKLENRESLLEALKILRVDNFFKVLERKGLIREEDLNKEQSFYNQFYNFIAEAFYFKLINEAQREELIELLLNEESREAKGAFLLKAFPNEWMHYKEYDFFYYEV